MKNMKFKISSTVIALLVSLCFQGCKSTDSVAEENSNSSLEIGKAKKQDVINMLGKPHSKTVDKNGFEHWVYELSPSEASKSEVHFTKMEFIFEDDILANTMTTGFDPSLVGKVIEVPNTK
jgi:outer membrane protein assembly factor BamE (lipoprotein component of BamABCDE complex)